MTISVAPTPSAAAAAPAIAEATARGACAALNASTRAQSLQRATHAPAPIGGGEACSAEIKACKEEKEKKAEEEGLAGILIGVGVGVLIIVGIIVGVSCYCKKARNIAPSGTVQGVAMPAQPGVQSQPQPAVQSQPQQQGKAAQLKELKELLDAGALTQDEFDSQKKEVLAGKS